MTVTEAGACGTPSVATRISGHQDAVVDGRTGILVDGPGRPHRRAGRACCRDDVLRKRLGLAALEHASRFTWDATARGALAALGAEALARSLPAGPGPERCRDGRRLVDRTAERRRSTASTTPSAPRKTTPAQASLAGGAEVDRATNR